MVSRRVSWSFLFLFSPITAVYTASIMAQWIGPVAMLASWIALIVVGGDVHNGSPMFLIALVILMNEFDPVSLLKSGYLNKKKRDY